jgi:pyruvate carboxylase subunit B
MKKIEVLVTAFRDGIQSAYGARVRQADLIPAVEAAARAGLRRFEAGGGAVFQAAVLYCGEDPFDRMEAFRRAAGPGAELQVLSRGVSLVGLEPQSRELISLYSRLLKRHGIDAVRNFDALNDLGNLAESGKLIVREGLGHEATICITDPPPGSAIEGVHSPEYYRGLVRGVLESGLPFDGICFKDSAGTTRPRKVYETVHAARKLLGEGAHIAYHTHDTVGLGIVSCLAAVKAGADRIDLSLSPLSGGACQPDLVTFWHALRDSGYDLDIDIKKVLEVEELLKSALKGYVMVPEAARTDPVVLFYPMPGGALAANANLLRDQGLSERYGDIIHAIAEVFAKGGGGAPVTPVSQYYVQQAYENVAYGPWARIAPGYGRMVLGYLGKTPASPDPEILALASKSLGLGPATDDPLTMADRDPARSLAATSALLAERGILPSDEALAIAALCGEKGLRFLKGESTLSLALPYETAPGAVSARPIGPALGPEGSYTVTVNERAYGVSFREGGVVVDGVSYSYGLREGIDEALIERLASLPEDEAEPALVKTGEIRSPLPGMIMRLNKRVGDKVAVGETVLVLESMTAEIPVNSRLSGVVSGLFAAWGDRVEAGQELLRVSVLSHGSLPSVSQAAEARSRPAEAAGCGGKTVVVSPLAGLVLRIYKAPGERILAGESILVIESMKMERPVNSVMDGVIESLQVRQGDRIAVGQALAILACRDGEARD